MGSGEVYSTVEYVRNLDADTIMTISLGVGLAMAFTKAVRRRIIQRDGGCTWDKDDTPHIGGLEASHYDHSRGRHYNDESNGTTRCTAHHLAQHIDDAGNNGLSEAANNWAIGAIMDRLTRYIADNE